MYLFDSYYIGIIYVYYTQEKRTYVHGLFPPLTCYLKNRVVTTVWSILKNEILILTMGVYTLIL